jgi:hypothetical protein
MDAEGGPARAASLLAGRLCNCCSSSYIDPHHQGLDSMNKINNGRRSLLVAVGGKIFAICHLHNSHF